MDRKIPDHNILFKGRAALAPTRAVFCRGWGPESTNLALRIGCWLQAPLDGLLINDYISAQELQQSPKMPVCARHQPGDEDMELMELPDAEDLEEFEAGGERAAAATPRWREGEVAVCLFDPEARRASFATSCVSYRPSQILTPSGF